MPKLSIRLPFGNVNSLFKVLDCIYTSSFMPIIICGIFHKIFRFSSFFKSAFGRW